MKNLRVIFMGTPDFAVPCLQALYEHTEVTAVVTQPDKPKGRGQKLMFSPVKEWALEHELPVYQPPKVRDNEFIQKLRELKPDIIVVVAFGQILSQAILDIPPLGCVNVHASLLPRYRGAAPMQWCIINGETKTGVTTMLMDAGLDTGDMLLKEEITIGENTTLEELHDQLMQLGAGVLLKTIDGIVDGKISAIKQPEISNYAPMIAKDTGHIDWQKPAAAIHNLVRGLNSWPGAYTYLNGEKYKIWQTVLTSQKSTAAAGTIVAADKNSGLLVATGDELLKIVELQAPGKKKMKAADFLNGHSIKLPANFDIN